MAVYFVIGALLVVWALVLTFGGMARVEDFPRPKPGPRADGRVRGPGDRRVRGADGDHEERAPARGGAEEKAAEEARGRGEAV